MTTETKVSEAVAEVMKATEPEGAGQPGGAQRMMRVVRAMTQKRYSAEDKIRIVMEGMRKEMPASQLSRREGLSIQTYYTWVKDFMEGGMSRLKGDTVRNANRDEVDELKRENARLKEIVGEQSLTIHALKKSVGE